MNKHDLIELGLRIKNRRKELQISQEELAEKAGYTSRSSISKIETGNSAISINKLVELAQALNVTPSLLLGWEEDITFNSDNMESVPMPHNLMKIPIMTTINAGNHCKIGEAVTGYMHIDKISLGTSKGDYVAITIKGTSMLPVFKKGDTVVVLRQNECKDGEIALVIINNKVTIKKILNQGKKLILQPINNDSDLIFCDSMDCNIKIYGIPKIIQRRV